MIDFLKFIASLTEMTASFSVIQPRWKYCREQTFIRLHRIPVGSFANKTRSKSITVDRPIASTMKSNLIIVEYGDEVRRSSPEEWPLLTRLNRPGFR